MAYDGDIKAGDRYRLCVPGREMVSVLVIEVDGWELTLRNLTHGDEYIDDGTAIRKHGYLVSRNNPTD